MLFRKNSYNKIIYKVVSIIPILALTILAGFFISGGVHATGASSDTEVILEADSIINISAPSTATLNCTPGATAATSSLCTTLVTIEVGTNSPIGYTLQMNATNGSPTALTNTAISPSATIPTLSQSYSSANFPANYWGYTGGLNKSGETGGYNCSTNYCPILAYSSDSAAYAPNHVIKVTDSPAISSNTNISFGAKVDISKPSGTYSTSVTFTAVTNSVSEVPLMQEFDSAACSNATTDETFTVKDSRNNVEYTAAKLKDGNCWMTQNLALGSSTTTSLTAADSDVSSSGYTLPASDSISGTDTGVLDYAGEHAADQANNKFGNYYTWSVATAGSSLNTADGDDAEYSICPKNWHLPSEAEFGALISAYTELSSPDSALFSSPPLSFVFSGEYGEYGSSCLWGSTAYDTWGATTLFAGEEDWLELTHDSTSHYYSVRCLIPGQ